MGKECRFLSVFISFLQPSGPNFIINIKYLTETMHRQDWHVLAFPLPHESIQSHPPGVMAWCGSVARSNPSALLTNQDQANRDVWGFNI